MAVMALMMIHMKTMLTVRVKQHWGGRNPSISIVASTIEIQPSLARNTTQMFTKGIFLKFSNLIELILSSGHQRSGMQKYNYSCFGIRQCIRLLFVLVE